MQTYSLLSEADVQLAYATHIRKQRKLAKLSREALAIRSTVPASTIKKFELTGQISFRQLLLLWQSVDDLDRIYKLTQVTAQSKSMPTSIAQVLKDEL
ncbi:MAG: helix-turn-helix domain-containing protein [Paraglaciecola sp.]|nr:helix-turn-helix domain-containing protein [Paraglaciecola sp.]